MMPGSLGNIYLVGLMGSGKTTVGKRLATMMQMDFVDTDQLLEKRTGVSISHIFEVEGEEGFRMRESKLLEELSLNEGQVVSTGGGIVLSPDNRTVMIQTGKVVYLRASFNILWGRLRGCQKRPLLQTDDPAPKIRKLIEERSPLYEQIASIAMDINPESAAKMARKIHQRIKNLEDS